MTKEKIEYFEGETSSGFKYKIDKRRVDNYELIEAMSELETNETATASIKIIKMLLGDDEQKLKEHVTKTYGWPSIKHMQAEITEIFEGTAEAKN